MNPPIPRSVWLDALESELSDYFRMFTNAVHDEKWDVLLKLADELREFSGEIKRAAKQSITKKKKK